MVANVGALAFTSPYRVAGRGILSRWKRIDPPPAPLWLKEKSDTL